MTSLNCDIKGKRNLLKFEENRNTHTHKTKTGGNIELPECSFTFRSFIKCLLSSNLVLVGVKDLKAEEIPALTELTS